MTQYFSAFLILFFCVSSLSAQGLARGGIRALRKNPSVFKATRSTFKINAPAVSATLETPEILLKRLELEKSLRQSVGSVTGYTAFRPDDVCDSFSSGTVIADDSGEYWVVLSHHGTHSSLGKPLVEFHVNGKRVTFHADIVITGTRAYTDLALAKVPEKYKSILKPVQLADKLPSPGEIGSSYGFGSNRLFQSAHNQQVIEANPIRLTLQYEPANSPFVGGCGGPFIIGNQIAGFPCGFSVSSNKRYMIPSTAVKNLIAAAHNNGIALSVLKFNGKTIGTINVDQSVSQVLAFNGKKMIADAKNNKTGKFVDYEKLEKVLDPFLPTRMQQEVTDLYFILTRDNILTTNASQPDLVLRQTFLHYNVQTAQSEVLTVSQKLLFHYFNKLPKTHTR